MSEFEFEARRFYCAHCPLTPDAPSYPGAYTAKEHVRDVHHIPPMKAELGEDIYEGWQAQRKWEARQIVANAEFKTPWRGDDTYGVEDFLTDIGDEPWESALSYEEDE